MAEMSIIKSRFLGAVEQKSPEKRLAYVDEDCPDPGTRAGVERLLAADLDARVLPASHDGTARLWDASTGDDVLTLEHEKAVLNVAISLDDRQIATRTVDELFFWDAATGREGAAWQSQTMREHRTPLEVAP